MSMNFTFLNGKLWFDQGQVERTKDAFLSMLCDLEF